MGRGSAGTMGVLVQGRGSGVAGGCGRGAGGAGGWGHGAGGAGHGRRCGGRGGAGSVMLVSSS